MPYANQANFKLSIGVGGKIKAGHFLVAMVGHFHFVANKIDHLTVERDF